MQLYDKSNLFLAAITDRYRLSAPVGGKNTFHITLSLKGSGIKYRVGDSIAIQPVNAPDVVEATMKAIGATGHELIIDKKGNHSSFIDFLTRRANLAEVPRKLIAELAHRQTDPDKQRDLQEVVAEGQRERLKAYQASHEVWDVLQENSEVKFLPQELCLMLQPLLPRFYSISSAMIAVGEEVHLTVAEVSYETNGHQRRGACTYYLCDLAEMHRPEVGIYIQPSNGFTLPENPHLPIVMVGPGTGVAPFRAFMQEREVVGGEGGNWLFFGERHRSSRFFYENYWQELVQNGRMKLSTAFSRDQEQKVYVQHRLLEHGQELFDWIERGAYFYVCGDASRMAKDVDAALHQLVRVHGKYSEQGAVDYIKNLKSCKRYLRDVY